jgi:succinoglycan biosynthesis transport protein ExoP
MRERDDYLRLLWRRRIVVVLAVALGAGIALGTAAIQRSQYSATVQLFVATTAGDNVQNLLNGGTFAQNEVASYAVVARTPFVLDPIAGSFHIRGGVKALATHVSATVPGTTVLVNITVTWPSARRAAALANAIGTRFATVAPSLQGSQAASNTPLRLQVVAPATIPTGPSSPRKGLYLAVGILLGFGVGWLLAVLIDVRDTRLTDETQLSALSDAPVLAVMPNSRDLTSWGAVFDEQATASMEVYRQLRTNLEFASLGLSVKCLLITSAVGNEGKTTTAAHLGLALSEMGASALLIEADLRRPRLAAYMGLDSAGQRGLTDAVIGAATISDVILPAPGLAGLDLLPMGSPVPNPTAILGAERLRVLLESLRSRHDYLILDAAPILSVSDAIVLSAHCDGAIVVVGAGIARKGEVTQALNQLSFAKVTLLGLLLNRSRRPRSSSYGYVPY